MLFISFIIFIIFFFIFVNIFNKKQNKITTNIYNNKKNSNNKNNCYISPENSNLKIIHVITTRYLFNIKPNYTEFMKSEEYTQNAIRVLNKYLLPSLENQRCQDFIWIFMVGDLGNISYIKSKFNFHNSFKTEVIYESDMKNYLRQLSKGYDVLITTRIDYDDVIFYDAVNDVRKEIDINKPVLVYGYAKGYYYLESNEKYYNFYDTYCGTGVMSVFASLIVILKKVNDAYSVNEIGQHTQLKTEILNKYKSFGINELNYNPMKVEKNERRFIWVRQKYSGIFEATENIKKTSKPVEFDKTKIYG